MKGIAEKTGCGFGRDKSVNEIRNKPSIIELYLISKATQRGEILKVAMIN